ncbi:hypothetical protein MSTO_14800 [Mycobacterium stomatepiae]|uniref:Uncharacterized protein n=1 Tax=Mycobacterium stomatepiae TaxID=470076 RepID=A0A7I7Q4K6_9MYCO|nr:hypothetical protein MSTO_14800 [Mycobacterium stomatepiae]
MRSQQFLVPHRPGQRIVAGLVVDVDQPHRRQLGCLQRLGQGRGEPRLIHHGFRAGIAQQIDQFVGDVTIVHVERGDPRQVCAQHALEVFVAVGHVQPEMTLPGFVRSQFVTFPAGAQSPRVQRLREPPGAFGSLRVGESSVSKHNAVAIRICGRDRREHLGEIEFH